MTKSKIENALKNTPIEELINKYFSTGSISKKERMGTEITSRVRRVYNKKIEIRKKYNLPYFESGYYLPNRGSLSFSEYHGNAMFFDYVDYSMGNEYNDAISMTVDEYNKFSETEYDDECRKFAIQKYLNLINVYTEEIEKLKNKINDLNNEGLNSVHGLKS